MSLINITKPLVSAHWLHANREASNLIILDATIKKINSHSNTLGQELSIPETRFFDLKQNFSDQTAEFPNTIPTETQFTEEAQALGVYKNSAIVIYDKMGIYSSPRAWWLFKTMGFNNVAVLDGGLPKWVSKGYNTSPFVEKYNNKVGDFEAKYNPKLIRFFETIKTASTDKSQLIIDARSASRFSGKAKEPRAGLRSGCIPNSINIPYTTLLNGYTLKPIEDLKVIFKDIDKNKPLIFSCGSGITACILALAATELNYNNISVYDGSWTEWGSLVS